MSFAPDTPSGYREIDHTADLALELWAPTEAELDPPSEMVIAGQKGAVLFQHVTEEFGLIAQLEPEATVGRVRYEMRKAASRLRPELEG